MLRLMKAIAVYGAVLVFCEPLHGLVLKHVQTNGAPCRAVLPPLCPAYKIDLNDIALRHPLFHWRLHTNEPHGSSDLLVHSVLPSPPSSAGLVPEAALTENQPPQCVDRR